MDDQEYKERVQQNLKNERKDLFGKLLVYATAFAIAIDIFFVLRVCGVEWTLNRSLTEATIYFIASTAYLLCFFFRKKLAKLFAAARDGLRNRKKR